MRSGAIGEASVSPILVANLFIHDPRTSNPADTKFKSSAPWIELDDDCGILCGNHAGFELLAGAIGEILRGGETAINLDGYDVYFQKIQLQERGIDPPPAESMVLRIVTYLFLVLLMGILGTSAFGTYQFFHLIFSS